MKNTRISKKPLSIVARCAVLGVILVAPTVSAQYPVPMGYPMMPQQSYPMMVPQMGAPVMPGMMPQTANPISALNLSQEQQQQITAIGQEARSQSVKVMNEIGNKFNELRNLFAAKVPDAQAIGAMYGEIFELQRQSIETAIATYNKQVDVLDEKQREMFDSMRQHMLSQFKPSGEAQQ